MTELTRDQAISVCLEAMAINFKEELTDELEGLWQGALSTLSPEQLQQGLKKSIDRLKKFPTIAHFKELAVERYAGSKRVPALPGEEPKKKYSETSAIAQKNMKRIMALWANGAEVPNGAIKHTVEGRDSNGQRFKMTRDAYGRDWVFLLDHPRGGHAS